MEIIYSLKALEDISYMSLYTWQAKPAIPAIRQPNRSILESKRIIVPNPQGDSNSFKSQSIVPEFLYFCFYSK